MKQILFKIVAISSVLLGALGPQVASGSSHNILSAEVTHQQIVSSYTLAVSESTTHQDNLQIQFQQGQPCWITGEQARLDLMLWTGCDNLAIATPLQRSSSNLVVIGQPEHLPTIAVENPVSFGVKTSIGSGAKRENSTLPILDHGFKTVYRTFTINPKSNTLSIAPEIKFSQVDNLLSIVMRC